MRVRMRMNGEITIFVGSIRRTCCSGEIAAKGQKRRMLGDGLALVSLGIEELSCSTR